MTKRDVSDKSPLGYLEDGDDRIKLESILNRASLYLVIS
jgi:hypothetical protein